MLRILVFLLALVALVVFGVVLVSIGAAAAGAWFGLRRLRAWRDRRQLRRARPADAVADPLESAWTLTAQEADWAVSRIAAARTSCARLIAIADADPLATDAVEWAGVIRRRVPDLVLACLNECSDATPSERRVTLDDLVDSLEKIAAEAERRRDRFREGRVTPFEVQRTYVDQRTRRGPLD